MTKVAGDNNRIEKKESFIRRETCPVTGLPVTYLSLYTDAHVSGKYYTSLKKIGDSVVHITSRGPLKDFNLEKFDALTESFCEETGVVKPYVQIRDLAYISGRMPLTTMSRQSKSFFEKQDKIIGLVTVNTLSWMKVALRYAISRFIPGMHFSFAKDYSTAIKAALQILAGEKPLEDHDDKQAAQRHKTIKFEDIIFKPEWEYINQDNSFRFRVGVIPGRFCYASLHGRLIGSRDVENIFFLMEKVIRENNLIGIKYVVADYSDLSGKITIFEKQLYVRKAKRINEKFLNNETTQFIVGASKVNKIAVKIFSGLMKQRLFFEDKIEGAFRRINEEMASGRLIEEDSVVLVSAKDIEEINNACGALLWGEEDMIVPIKVSPSNPLAPFAETMEIIRDDLAELRKKERDNHLKLSDEVNKAEIIHKRYLPRELPQTDSFTMAASYQPATWMGGDSYNAILSGNKLVIYLADVMGHAMEGAIFSVFINEAVENYVYFREEELQPAKILRHIDDTYRLRNFPEEHLICIFMAVIDLDTNEMEYSGAGFQMNPLITYGDGRKESLECGDLFISKLLPPEINNYKERKVTLSPGTTLIISTDGLGEQNRGKIIFQDKYEETFFKNSHLPPNIIVNEINKEFCFFNECSPVGKDDITFLVLQFNKTKRKKHSFAINSSIEELVPLLDKIEKILILPPGSEHLRSCLHELIANAIEHGNKLDPAKKVKVNIITDKKYIIAEVEDEGEGFHWCSRIEKPISLEHPSERGRGIAFTTALTPHLYYNNKGNKATIMIQR